MEGSKLSLFKRKREMNAEKPTVWIGKEGVAPGIVDEISRQLEKKEVVKVKILKSAIKKEEAEKIGVKIAQETESSLIDVRGHMLLLYKSKNR
jgi:RNA-binding protein